jgi:hypothetical protein
VEKVEIPLRLRDFQAQGESPAFGLFHGAAFSTALLPTDCAIDPEERTGAREETRVPGLYHYDVIQPSIVRT